MDTTLGKNHTATHEGNNRKISMDKLLHVHNITPPIAEPKLLCAYHQAIIDTIADAVIQKRHRNSSMMACDVVAVNK
jgi:hypothetical protein